MTTRVENINVEILRQCREQMALSIEDVKKKGISIEDIESRKRCPTFRQLDTLAEMYNVPRWVFISDQLPSKYNYVKSVPAFRQFAEQAEEAFSDPKVRSVTAQVEQLRELVIELRKDMDEPIEPFRPPEVKIQSSSFTAKAVRSWLNVENNLNLKFPKWKEKLEQKGIFIFMTDKYRGWSHIRKGVFRGLSMYCPVLPIIIISDFDVKEAQSFTLFHELGHLLKKEHAVDSCHESKKSKKKAENWCDRLAEEVLMPENEFRNATKVEKITELRNIEKLAKKFFITPSACLVRLQNLNIINRKQYSNFDRQRREKHEEWERKKKESLGGASRDRVREVLNQYGHIYIRTLFQAYHNKEITLHKLGKAFNLKRTSQVLELANEL